MNGTEKVEKSAIWNENFHGTTHGKGIRLIAIAPFKDDIGTDTLFSHKYIHRHMWF